MSDMAGYAARVAVERSGSCRDTMEPRGASDIDGQTETSIWAGAHESKLGATAGCGGQHLQLILQRAVSNRLRFKHKLNRVWEHY